MPKVNFSKNSFGGRIFRAFLLVFASFLLFSCGTSGNASKNDKNVPDWVISGAAKKYPKSSYLTGIGSGSDRTLAELDAIESLVSIFGQHITSASAGSRRMEQAKTEGIVATSDSSALGQDILRKVDQNDVIAVEIPEFYEAKSENKWYALAIMSRERGTQIYSGMIQKNQAEISTILKQFSSETSPNTLQNFSRLDFAEDIAKLNEGYLKRLTILNPEESKKFESISTPVQIHKIKSEMAMKIPVCVTVNEDPDGRISKAFQEVMSEFGFNTTLGSGERYVISCKNHFKQSVSTDGKTQFCEYSSECALTDTFLGETLVPLLITGREGSPTYDNAVLRSKQKISAKIKEDFSKNFKNYLGDYKK